MSSNWPKIEVRVDPAAAEDIGAELLDAGATGVEQRDGDAGSVLLIAYFSDESSIADIADRLAAREGVLSPPETGSIPDDDWLRIWKRGFEPIPIGKRLLVLPTWKRDRAGDFPDRVRIEIDPGMAFGTGTHETTRLCLEWIDSEWKGGSLLDVGTGTGILAMAAKLLEPSSTVAAVDVDPVAVGVARENAEMNSADLRFDIGGPADVEGQFDVVMANITADTIISVQTDLLARLKDGGELVVSGILVEQRAMIEESFRSAGLEQTWHREDGEWCALAWSRA